MKYRLHELPVLVVVLFLMISHPVFAENLNRITETRGPDHTKLHQLPKTPLQGSYTIGGNEPDFSTFSEAVDQLIATGIGGAVVFNIREGTYFEQIKLPEISGSSSINTITFQSESGDSTSVILTFSATSAENYTLFLDGADWVTFQHMTLSSTNQNYSTVVRIENEANHNNFINNRLQGPLGRNGTTFNALIASRDFVNASEHIQILNNLLEGNSYGLVIARNTYSQGWVIMDNIFRDQYYGGIDASNFIGIKIIRNTVMDYSGSYWSYRAMLLSRLIDSTRIEGNRLVMLRSNVGMNLYDLQGTPDLPVVVANNYIYASDAANIFTGISIRSSAFVDLVFNTIHIDRDYATSTAINCSSLTGARFLNNILANMGGGYIFSTIDGGFVSEHNNLYTTGPFFAYRNYEKIDFPAWQAASLQDSASIFIDPAFKKTGDFAVNESLLNGAGVPLNLVLTDIEGQQRNSTFPDIGCDEFDPFPTDAALTTFLLPEAPFSPGNHELVAVLKNNGTTELNSATIRWEVNGIPQPEVHWTGTLPTTKLDTFTLGTIDFQNAVDYDLQAWTSTPNQMPDLYPANDTVRLNDVYAALQGVYTLGGSDADFPSFSQAGIALEKGGVLGPVTIKVRDGIYNEQLNLGAIIGTDSLQTVNFQSEAGDSSKVSLRFAASADANYTLRLNGAAWLSFRNMSIEATGSLYTTVVRIENKAHHLSFSHNQILAPTGDNEDYGVLVFRSTLNEYLSFNNNWIDGNEVGLEVQGFYEDDVYASGLEIRYNRFTNQHKYALYSYAQYDPKIIGNQIHGSMGTTNFIGIYLNGYKGNTRIENNHVDLRNGGLGLYLAYAEGTPENHTLIANNFVQLSGNEESTGIYCTHGKFQDVLYNSVSINSPGPFTSACTVNDEQEMHLYNNIFSNQSEGRALLIISSEVASNNNDLFTAGPTLAMFNNTSYSDLTSWIAGTELDQASISVYPLFVNDTLDLHTHNSLLDKQGIPLAAVRKDIDGINRDPIHPDIGADEFSSEPLDAAVFQINTPEMLFPANDQTINISLLNNGLDTLEHALIQWEVNGLVQPSFPWTGKLPYGAVVDSLDIGSFPFEVGTTYTIRAWTSAPNGALDTDMSNDTARLGGLHAALAGTYTIGGHLPDFPSIRSAVQAMTNGGVLAPVIFLIRDGIYQEQIRIPEIAGVDSLHTVSFQSESGDSSKVIWTYASTAADTNYTLLLDGADWMNFHSLSFRAEGAEFGRVIVFDNKADHHLFAHNRIEGQAVSISTGAHYLISSPIGELNEFHSFLQNEFLNGSEGLAYYGKYPPSYAPAGLRIEGNRFMHQFSKGVQLFFQNAALIASNYFENASNGAYEAIRLLAPRQGVTISANQIFANAGGIGVYIGSNESGQYALISNNFMKIGGTQASYGLYSYFSTSHKIYHNTIYLTNTNRYTSRCVYLYSSSDAIMKNNILVNTGGGVAFDVNNPTNLSSDYNNFFITGTNVNPAYKDLASWQAGTGHDTHSYAIDPLFLSADSYEVSEVDLNNAGIPLPEVTTDINGEARSPNQPDIGADEFSPRLSGDAGISAVAFPNQDTRFAAGWQAVKVVLKNNGADPIHQVNIHWMVNDIVQPVFTWSGHIVSGERDTVTIGSFNFSHQFSYQITAFTDLPNHLEDPRTTNDTTSVQDLHTALNGTYTIGGVAPDYSDFNSAVRSLNKGGVLGPVVFLVRDGDYQEQITIQPVSGSDHHNRIIFRSESGERDKVRLTYAGDPYNNFTVFLEGADFITFKDLTLESEGPNTGMVIVLSNQADNNEWLNNVIRNTGNQYDPVVLSNSAANNSDNTFIGNLILDGDIGLYLAGKDARNLEAGTVVKNNIFEGQHGYPLYLSSQVAPEIVGNQFIENNSKATKYSIALLGCTGATRILNNKIAGANGGGITLEFCTANEQTFALIANNFISIHDNLRDAGINIYYSSYQRVYHNTVHINNTDVTSRALHLNKSDHISLLNNIFAHSGGGYAIFSSSTDNLELSDHNDFFTTGSTLANWAGTNATTLADWQALSGLDAHSLAVDPLFFSEEDLHVAQPALDGSGYPTPEVLTDIDGEIRSATHPDIGADEVELVPLQDLFIESLLRPRARCTFSKETEIAITVGNKGKFAASNFSVAYRINDDDPIIESVNGLQISRGETIQYTFRQKIDLSAFRQVPIEIYTIFPADTSQQNDTLKLVLKTLSDPAICACNFYNIYLGNETLDRDYYLAESEIISSGKVRSGANVTFRAGKKIVLRPGFKVESGATFYGLIDRCVQLDYLEKPILQEQAAVTAPKSNFSAKAIPNPFQNTTLLVYDLAEQSPISITLHDISGKKIRTLSREPAQLPGRYSISISGSELAAGWYNVQLVTSKTKAVVKLILIK